MQIKTTYKGYIDGVYGIYCGFKPEKLIIDEQIQVYYPDENKIFIKGNKEYLAVILENGENIEDYIENAKI